MTGAGGLKIGALQLLCLEPTATARFYEDAFDAERNATSGDVMIGTQRIVLAPGRAARSPYPPSNATSFQHFAIIVSDMPAAVAQLGSVGGWTAISRSGPEKLPSSSGGVTAFKFRDPDGHPLEFLAFPPDATPASWRQPAKLFMGIDHTAIAVTDTERSIGFYEGLGFEVGTRGVNQGLEQARMDDVDDPLVDVTALVPRGGQPPHLELLCYRRPGVLQRPAEDGDALATSMLFEGASLIGPDRDPDGHRFEPDRRSE